MWAEAPKPISRVGEKTCVSCANSVQSRPLLLKEAEKKSPCLVRRTQPLESATPALMPPVVHKAEGPLVAER